MTFHETAQQFPKRAVCPILTQLAPALLHLFRGDFLAILPEPRAGAIVLILKAELLRLTGSFLPFLLGVGMALPWPLAGAGLAWLPKPGRWMVWIRHGFGVLVIVMAAYYGRLAWSGFRPAAPPAGSVSTRWIRPSP